MNLPNLIKVVIIISFVINFCFSPGIESIIAQIHPPGILKWIDPDSLTFLKWLNKNKMIEDDLIVFFPKFKDEELLKYAIDKSNRLFFLRVLYFWQKNTGRALSYLLKIDLYSGLISQEFSRLATNRMSKNKVKYISAKVQIRFLELLCTEEYIDSVSTLWLKEMGVSFFMEPTKYRNTCGRVRIEAKPKNSEVYINGKFIDYTEKEFVILANVPNIINVKHPGYESFSDTITVEPGKKIIISCELKGINT